MDCKIIKSGSDGNCVLYGNSIVVDMGVGFKLIKPHLSVIKIILLSHSHSDHINVNTIKNIQSIRPSVRVGCCEWMTASLDGVNNIDVYDIGSVYDYGNFKVCPFKLYHDVPNCGYRIFIEDKKIFHATDTAHLEGISANEYDVFALEHNYDADTIHDKIKEIEANGGYAHQKGSINTHLSEQQARDFIYKNKKHDSVVVRLHESKNN